MGDKFSHLLTVAIKYIDRLTVLAFTIICGTVLYYRFMVSPERPSIPTPNQVLIETPLPPLIPNPDYDRVKAFLDAESDIGDPRNKKFSVLSEFDPFNLGQIRSQDQIDRDANAGMRRAEQFLSQRQYDECIQECRKVLRMDSERVGAKEMIRKCEEAQKAATGN